MLDFRFYYLENFETALAWIAQRYADLMSAEEAAFIEDFKALPQASRALLVRTLMRKGDLFRASKLRYEEIGDTRAAAEPLIAAGWVDAGAPLTLDQLFALLRKSEIAQVFRMSAAQASLRKADQLELLRPDFGRPQPFAAWCAEAQECAADIVYRVGIAALCERMRLMFFGNLYQEWSEFVLADLGIFKYEKVEISESSRGFRTRRDVDDYLRLHRCRERLEQGESAEDIRGEVRAVVPGNPWLASRREKLLFQLAQQFERRREWRGALDIYSECVYPGARMRRIRVLERCELFAEAFEIFEHAARAPESEAEAQQLARIGPRLQRKLGRPRPAAAASPLPGLVRLDLTLPRPEPPLPVEFAVAAHLRQADAPAFYVENTLINSLFGLLCWNAVFAAVPGAFFHPFHQGPADLHSADFHQRRAGQFSACLSLLDSDRYKEQIRQAYEEKFGTLSPFVFWDSLDRELLELALFCIPAPHLHKCFERILAGVKTNRSGLPDLIQFWPGERRYRMLEVKGPGDRLQDNQARWLEHFVRHGIPVAVCYVQWAEDAN